MIFETVSHDTAPIPIPDDNKDDIDSDGDYGEEAAARAGQEAFQETPEVQETLELEDTTEHAEDTARVEKHTAKATRNTTIATDTAGATNTAR